MGIGDKIIGIGDNTTSSHMAGSGYCEEPVKKTPDLIGLIDELENESIRLSEGKERIKSALTRLGAPYTQGCGDAPKAPGCVANDNAICRLSSATSAVRMRANDIHELADRLEQVI